MSKYKTYLPADVCSKCKGACCKRMAGHYSPSDFKDLSYEALKLEIEKGRISIDWWEGERLTKEYYLRARHVLEPIVCGSWGGVCMNLTETGCSLPWEERPFACRALKPEKNARCGKVMYPKEECKNDWKPYSDVLEKLAEYFRYATWDWEDTL